MPDINDEILFEVKKLSTKLYGENGFEGDIVEIKKSLKSHQKRITRLELIIASLIGSGALGAGIAGVAKLLGN